MCDTKWDTTVKKVKDLLLPNQYYAELSLDCECSSPYNEHPRRDCEQGADCNAVRPGLSVLRGYEYELRPIPYLEYIIHETPSRMANIFAALEYDPLLTVGLWNEREGSFRGEKVPYLQRRRVDSDDAWKTVYRDANYLSSKALGFDGVKASEDKDIFICAVAMNINEFLKTNKHDNEFDLAKTMSDHFKRLLWWTGKKTWLDLLEHNREFLRVSHENKKWPSFYSPYLGFLRQDCEKEVEYRSLVHLTDNGLLVLGGQGPDRGPDWRGGRIFRSTNKEYRRLPCLEFIVQNDPTSDFISNLLDDEKLAVNIQRGDGSVYKRDPNCCEHIQRDLKPDGLWEQQQVSERSLRHFCLDHLQPLRRKEVFICTVAMKITENTKDMLMGEEEDFVEATTAFDLIHRITMHIDKLKSLNHAKNLHQLFEVYDNFIDHNFNRQDVENLKTLRKNGLLALKDLRRDQIGFEMWRIPLLKLAFLRNPIKERFISRISQDRELAVGSWNGQDGSFRDMNTQRIYETLSIDLTSNFPFESVGYVDEHWEISLEGSVLEHVEPLKDQDVIICIIAMRADELIDDRDKKKLSTAIKNFDIAERVAAHIEAVNSEDSVSEIVSSKRLDDRSHTRSKQEGIPQRTTALAKTDELREQPNERRLGVESP
ncbi:hypothetical protein FOXB_16891 [Fusarium oxysporum f. sp. conglutinans Fo5176]|uniref:Uncharacterized protein n=1 Tax=Fusarium oxysporum (strain Fo5176) TaxID=660025 RepID=F9GE07_FUSOF|nr:hypothetical protein FOXB_16891 [Fusarium oxysporum f. sp. conglutinans Fo5176]KAI8404621.1 hypothetical protein FOFC_16116 [Fusarium oxysporum]